VRSASQLCDLVTGTRAKGGFLVRIGQSTRMFTVLAALCLVPILAAADTEPVQKAQLIGAWRLVGMDYLGPDGSHIDPFYQPNSTGLIIYDASGWMSVQIAGPHRQAWKVPVSRLPTTGSPQDSGLKAAALDTYYAYVGTWDFDETRAVVTHHVTAALLPAEEGQSYAQKISFENGRLIFTTHTASQSGPTVRRKIWERVFPP
jgi:hypothetical protein